MWLQRGHPLVLMAAVITTNWILRRGQTWRIAYLPHYRGRQIHPLWWGWGGDCLVLGLAQNISLIFSAAEDCFKTTRFVLMLGDLSVVCLSVVVVSVVEAIFFGFLTP